MATIDDLKLERLKKLEQLKKRAINPYPSKVKREHSIDSARQMEGKKVSVAGRVMALRGHGKILFGDILDESGKIQLLFKSDILPFEKFEIIDLLDIGDFLFVSGTVGKTQAGEITIIVENFDPLVKTIRPLPNTWHGLKDVEERYRKRYLDMLLNPIVRERLKMRGAIVESIREFLTKNGFLEVETPTLQHVYGGGFAHPFVTHHNALDADFYLRISDEMYLKRLIVGGFEKVFEITKVFRNEGLDHDHNPEFTMFEAQIAYEDYTYGMDIIEEIIENAAQKVLGNTSFQYQGVQMSVKRPWPRFTLVEAIKKFTGVDPLEWKTVGEAKKVTKTLQIPPDKIKDLDRIQTIGETIAFVFEHTVEEKLIQPTIIYDFPIEVSPLAKKCDDPRFTQRFEMFVFGSELGNNYTELNDPIDLRQRFVEEKKREQAGFAEAHQTDYDYLEAIEHGFPPTCGIAIGIDRFVMLLTDARNIKEVIAFPTLRPENGNDKKLKQDFNQKFVIVIDPELPAWQIMNTSSHAAAFLGNKMQSTFDTGKYFVTRDGVNLPRNSQYAIVTLSANKEELKNLAKEVRASGLLHIGYVPEMMETTDDAELAELLNQKNEKEVYYAGIGIFGPKNEVDLLTKKFSLWGKKPIQKSSQKEALNITRNEAFILVNDWVKNKNLVKHMLSVEAEMRALAKHFGEDEELWGLVGLLHDADWEKTETAPQTHTLVLAAELERRNVSRELITIILSHNFEMTKAGREPQTRADWAIYTCDELSGLIVATALVRPDKKLSSVTLESVKKKWANPSFAKGIDRKRIEKCTNVLGIGLDEFVTICLTSIQQISADLGL